MKQKITSLLLLFSAIFFTSAMAQSGLSLRFDIGAGLPSGTGALINYQNSNYTVAPYSLGSGFNVALSGNYMFSEHIGAGLDLNEMIGYNATQTTDDPITGATSKSVYNGSLFAITPNLILSANSDGINPYGRFGVVIGLASFKVTSTESGTGAQTGSNIDSYTGGSAIGVYAAFGVQFPLSDKLKLDVELFDRDLAYMPGNYANTQAYDGNSTAPSRTLTTSNADPNNLTMPVPFGSVGLKVGVSLSL